jgi:ribose 5-phosphate isomerase B
VTSGSGLSLGVGADDIGTALKDYIVAQLTGDSRLASLRDFSDEDPGVTSAYPVVALRVSEAIARGHIDRAILICGTGIGMCITANKVPGVRAAVVHDSYAAERSVLSNNCQVMALGSRIIAEVSAYRLVNEWLGYEFDSGTASAGKLKLIDDYETTRGGHSA